MEFIKMNVQSNLKNDTKRRIKDLMQNLCEENEWVLAIFYAPMNLRHNNNFCTSKDMPFFQRDTNDESITAFREYGDTLEYRMNQGNIGRVWAN